jgi:hypothetical protein
MRTTLSSASGATAVLQREVPKGGPKMVEMEGAAEIPGDKVR